MTIDRNFLDEIVKDELINTYLKDRIRHHCELFPEESKNPESAEFIFKQAAAEQSFRIDKVIQCAQTQLVTALQLLDEFQATKILSEMLRCHLVIGAREYLEEDENTMKYKLGEIMNDQLFFMELSSEERRLAIEAVKSHRDLEAEEN